MKTKHPEADFDTEELRRVHVIIFMHFVEVLHKMISYLVKQDFYREDVGDRQ